VEFDLLPAVPKFAAADRLGAIRRSMPLYNAMGTTSVYEGHGSSPETIACYRQLAEENALTVRTSLTVSPTWNDAEEADRAMRDWLCYARRQGVANEWLRISGVFIGLATIPSSRGSRASRCPTRAGRASSNPPTRRTSIVLT
jgi:predicted amidohydrolase YtcJ